MSNGSEGMPEHPHNVGSGGDKIDAVRLGNVENPTEDFIYFNARPGRTSYWTCTCGEFTETDTKGVDRMIKKVTRHAERTGHKIKPRGN